MANRRNIKKDIEYLVFEVISDCYTFKYLFPDKNHKEADKIIKDTINLRNELRMRVNHPDEKDNRKLVKAHYKKINEDLMNKVDNYFDRLNKMLADVQKTGEPAKTGVSKEAKEEKTTKAP